MMIELGETKVLKRQAAQPFHRLIDSRAALAHLIQQRFDLHPVHRRSFPAFVLREA